MQEQRIAKVVSAKRFRMAAAVVILASCGHGPRVGELTALRLLPPDVAADATLSGVVAFSRHPKFVEAKISPKGSYVAVITASGGRRSLAFVNPRTRQFTSAIEADSETMVGDFYWVNDERIVVELLEVHGTLASPVSAGQLYAVDATAQNGKLIFGYRGWRRDFAWSQVLSTLRNDDRRVLIEVTSWTEVGDRVAELYKIDVYTGKREWVCTSPIPFAEFLIDENGEPRIAKGWNEKLESKFFYREPNGGWRTLPSPKALTSHSVPVGFMARHRTVYFTEPAKDGFDLYAANIDTGDRKHLGNNEFVPPSSLVRDESGEVVAVEYEPDVPIYDFLLPEHPLSRMLQGLLANFPSEHVRLVNSTKDGKKAIVLLYGDRNPGRFLYVDVDANSAEPIFEARPWIRPEWMAEMTSFHINASDGQRIHGYLTLPKVATVSGTASPLVVLPHGGPHAARDHWGFDPDVQFLASEGFAVLQVNYRGSHGYGSQYEEAGYGRWADRVVQDIIDATRWTIGKGWVDSKRVCSFGASFGGYAAVQSAILAPDLFRCAVGYAGIYDLTLLSEEAKRAHSRLGRAYVSIVAGADTAALKQASPVYHAEKIEAAVLLIHGKKDVRAPLKHAEELKESMARKGRRVEWLVEPREGHGFYDERTREKMYRRVLSFLRQNTRLEMVSAHVN